MAGEDNKRRTHRKRSHSIRKSHKSHENHDLASPSVTTSARVPDLEVVRKPRLENLDITPEERENRMKYLWDQPVTSKSRSKKEDKRDTPGIILSARRKSEEPRKRRRKRETEEQDTQSDDGYVYGKSDGKAREEKPTSKSRSRQHPAIKATARKSTPSKATNKRESPRRRNSCPEEDSTIVSVAAPPRRQTVPAQTTPRPSLRRSGTTGTEAPTEVSSTARSTVTSTPSKRRDSSLFSSLLLPTSQRPAERKISCLTCGSDDVPISKSARLPCKHRMCNTCLKRIFKLSITDPAHMPPRCCTSDHIALQHVDKLFNQEFKRSWNRKFLEFQTKNKIYCINRNCGEWIKPNHIMIEHGRKIGKCKKCSTRVCAICNNKAHTSRDCPKDLETKRFIDTAREKGWQKCYSCSAMVELKEGCNHMTCRCTAEFCMVCGEKWKSCDCPWFNYEAADAHLGNPARYQEEMDRRRDQELRDEELARRMQALGVGYAAAQPGRDQEIWGVGNAAGHHMNANFYQQARDVLTANYANAEQAARGLINGFMTGRENPLPGFPGGLEEINTLLRQQDPAPAPTPERFDHVHWQGGGAVDNAGDRPVRRGTNRRRNPLVDMLTTGGRSQTAEEREQERTIEDWARGVRPP